MKRKPSPEPKTQLGLTIQEMGILHLTWDFQRDFPAHPCTNFDDYEGLLQLTPNEVKHAVAHLSSLGLIDTVSSDGEYILTCDGLKLFDSGYLGDHTLSQVFELRDEREAIVARQRSRKQDGKTGKCADDGESPVMHISGAAT